MELSKKSVNEMVARVREVVQNVSTNDIVLALHSYDMNVERTIQALCEDRNAVLDEWVRPKKNKKPTAVQKKKPEEQKQSAPAPVAPSTTHTHKPEAVLAPSVSLVSQPKTAPARQTNGFHAASTKNSSSEADWLQTYDAEAAQVATHFAQECSRGREQIQKTFQALKQLLVEKEQLLLNALSQSQKQGERIIQDNRKTGKTLLQRSKNASSDVTFAADLKAFTAQRKVEQQLATAVAFQYDLTNLVKDVNAFGSVVEVTKTTAHTSPVAVAVQTPSPTLVSTIKHSNSHSSIVSSEHDSGLGGHVSPVSVDEKKSVSAPSAPKTQMATGGLQMSSDGLTAEQLAAIQKSIEAQFAARGLDPSLVTAGAGVVPPRPRKERVRNNDKKPAGKMAMPELSIMS